MLVFVTTARSFMDHSPWKRRRTSSAASTPSLRSELWNVVMRIHGVDPSVRIGPPRCSGPPRWANTGAIASESAKKPTAAAVWRCDDFTVLTSQMLNRLPRDVLSGSQKFDRESSNLHGRRGTRTPDFLRVRQAL